MRGKLLLYRQRNKRLFKLFYSPQQRRIQTHTIKNTRYFKTWQVIFTYLFYYISIQFVYDFEKERWSNMAICEFCRNDGATNAALCGARRYVIAYKCLI